MSLLAHFAEVLNICVLWVLMFWVSFYFFMGWQIELFSLLKLETCFLKDSSRISWCFDLRLLLFRFYVLLQSGM